MAMLRMPYNNAMRLGQGVNSFTQQLCMIDAVKKKSRAQKIQELREQEDDSNTDENGPPLGISQIVSYSSRFVDKVSDVTNDMNISAALSIKAGAVSGSASGKYIDTDKFKESDLNFFIQVKVTNQEHMDADYTEFQKIEGVDRTRFAEVYGDTFISGWEEGGEFNALVSVRLHDKTTSTQISGQIEASLGKGLVEGKGSGELNRSLSEHSAETTITVNWSGGGQIKLVDALWTIDNMTKAAANFPDLVAMTPQRKYAILTKYTMLPSYLIADTRFSPLDYENAGIYSSYLLEAYTDYKALWKSLQVLSEECQAGLHNAELHESFLHADITAYLRKFEKDAKKAADQDEEQYELDLREQIQAALEEREEKKRESRPSHSTDSSIEHLGGENNNADKETSPDVDWTDLAALANRVFGRNKVKRFKPNLPIYKTFPATILGIQEAQHSCRLEMVKIVNEVDLVTKDPSIALDADRKTTFISAAIFKELVPEKVTLSFYDGNINTLSQFARASLQRYSDRISFCRMGRLWFPFETERIPDQSLFFNDLDLLQDHDRAFAIRMTTNNGIITSLVTYYTSGRAFHHGIAWDSGNSEHLKWNSTGKDLTRVLRSVEIQGHRQTSTEQSLVDKLTIEMSDGTQKICQAEKGSSERTHTILSPSPTSGWDFRGWWGYTSDVAGFTQLGAIWDLIRPKGEASGPPMYEAGALDSMPAVLKRYIQNFEHEGVAMGRYYQFSKCVGTLDHVTSNATPFASFFGDSWSSRAAPVQGFSFYWKDKAMYGIYGSCPIGNHMKFGSNIVGRTESQADSHYFDLSKNLAEIKQVKFQTKKNDKGQALLVRVWLSDGTDKLNLLADADSSAQGLESVVTVGRPASKTNQDWLFGGFYGLVGTSIENIGVVWVAKQAYSK